MKTSHVAALALCIGLLGCQQEEAPPAPVIRPVLSLVVSRHPGAEQTFVGTIDARIETNMAFQVLGQLVSRPVSAGDLVHTSDLLAAIDPTPYELNLRAAEAGLASAIASRDNARQAFDRVEQLKATGTAPAATWEAAKTSLEAAEAAFTQAQSTLAKARDTLGFAQLHADFDGVVTATTAEVGQTVAAGQTVLTLAKPDERDAVIDVPDWLADSYKLGSPFTVSLRIAPDLSTRGTLREIAPQSDQLTRTRRLKIAISDPPAGFRLGSIVAAMPDAEIASSIVLPASAILQKDGAAHVWKLTADDGGKTATAHLASVTLAPGSDDTVTILSGLAEGDRVATAGVNSLNEGQTVLIGGDRP